jgi:putative ABC transport system permease protein
MRDDLIRSRGPKMIADDNREELTAWIDERADELTAGGMSPDAARRHALEEFGDVTAAARYAITQDLAADRRVSVLLWLEEFVSDVRIAARMFARIPAVAAVVLLTLSLGVGATTAVFSIAQALLLRPLPYGGEDSLAYLAATDDGVIRPGLGGGRHSATALVALRERTTAFSGIATASIGNVILRGEGDPEQLWIGSLTPNAFDVLQARAAIGRTFVASDIGGRPVILLTDALWRRRFGADPAVVGRTIDFGGALHEIIGVMPPGFRVPTYEQAELIEPQDLTNILHGENSRHVRALRLFGRLRPGVSSDAAQADLTRVMRGLQGEMPRAFERIDTRLVPIRTAVAGDARPRLLLLLGAAVFVLLIAGANIAGVLLSRGVARRAELALRAALGAGRARLIRQFAAEGAVLAFLGAGLGLVVAQLGIGFLRQVALTALPVGTTFALESRVVAFGCAAALATSLVATMIPALTATHGIDSALRRGSGRTTPSRASRGMRLALVGAQLAVAVVLLVGAGLLLRTMARLAALDLGYAADHAVTFRPQFASPKSNAEQDVFYAGLYAQLQAIPGVVSAGGGNVPTSGQGSVSELAVEGHVANGRLPDVRYTPVSDDYFSTLRIPVIRGRVFTPDDRDGSPWVAVVSSGLAKHLWPDADPIGTRVRVAPDRPWAAVVGVVGDVRLGGADTPQPSVYTSQRQDHWPGGAPIVLRTQGDPTAITAAIRDAVRRVDPSVVVPGVSTLEDVRRGTPAIAERHLQMRLMVVFSIIALLVSAIGVYGVSAYAAHARAMEFGIRMALGASRPHVMWLAVRDTAVVAAGGTAAGIPLAWLLARRLGAILFAVQPFDLPTTVASIGLLALVVLIASIVPARRAALVDPVTSIRAE